MFQNYLKEQNNTIMLFSNIKLGLITAPLTASSGDYFHGISYFVVRDTVEYMKCQSTIKANDSLVL